MRTFAEAKQAVLQELSIKKRDHGMSSAWEEAFVRSMTEESMNASLLNPPPMPPPNPVIMMHNREQAQYVAAAHIKRLMQ